MKKALFVFIISLVTFSCCRNTKSATKTPLPKENAESFKVIQPDSLTKNPHLQNYRLIITFTSRGSGTNKIAFEMVNNYISGYEKSSNIKLNSVRMPWGREGEMDYVYRLTELNPQQQTEFIGGLKEVVKGVDRVFVKENTQPHLPVPEGPPSNQH